MRSIAVIALVACSAGCQPHGAETLAPASPSQAISSNKAASGLEVGHTTALAADVPEPCASHSAPRPVQLPPRPTLGDFWGALATQIESLDTSALRASYQEFAQRHEVDPETPGLFQDFVRLWVAFEATRDGGWWRLRWAVTDQEPTSTQIWKAWMKAPPEQAFSAPTAVAECDEISALFSVMSRHLGVRGVGLFYPTWNHTIAGWAPAALAGRGQSSVVLVPTTQIFLGCPSTFDETTFRSPKQVYEFPKTDLKDNTLIPPRLGAFLLEQVRAYGEASPELLALIRAKRTTQYPSSMGSCDQYRRELATSLRPKLSCADQRALHHLALEELKQPDASPAAVLSWLGEP